MKFSAQDLRNPSFERCFRGYEPEQVHELLDAVAAEWDTQRKELEQLQDENVRQAAQLRDFQARERGLADALQAAKSVSDELKLKATQEAARQVEEAEARARQIVAKAERRHASLLDEIKELKQQRQRLEQDMRSILGSHLMLLDNPVASRTDPYPVELPNARRRPGASVAASVTGPHAAAPAQAMSAHATHGTGSHSTTMKITEEDIITSRRQSEQEAAARGDHDWDFELEEVEEGAFGTLVGMGQGARTITHP